MSNADGSDGDLARADHGSRVLRSDDTTAIQSDRDGRVENGLSIVAKHKRCCRCRIDKFVSEFSKSSDCRDGLYPQCKACQSARLKSAYHADIEASRSSKRKYRKENLAREQARDRKRAPERREWRRAWAKNSERHKATRKAFKAARKRRVPEQYSAVAAVNNAFRAGKLERPTSCACSSLGGCYGALHAHHEDYARPLHFVGLCVGHHLEVHKRGVLPTNAGGIVIAPPRSSEVAR